MHLHIPGPPGYTSSTARIDEVLADAVMRRDKAGMMATLKQALIEGKAGGARKKIVLKHAPKEEGGTTTIH